MLFSSRGRQSLTAAADLAPTEARYPACFDRLRKHFPADLARAALDTVLLRARARAKFTKADAMYFTRESLEMASGEAVSRYRAERFAAFAQVADLCCGIGGDAIGLALAGRSVAAVDLDPVRLRMAEANVAAYGGSGRFICGDALSESPDGVDAAFADPGRRPGGKRTLAPDSYEPPVSRLVARFPRGFPLGVKVAPGLDRRELELFEASAEFISVSGELKECVLWFGALRTAFTRAAVLPGPHVLEGDPGVVSPISPVREYLYDLDPAVTRSGLVGLLAERICASRIDATIAFLTSDVFTPSPFAAAYRVLDAMPFHAKRVGEWLRARGIGRVTVVKRGSAVDADEVARRWKLRGNGHCAVLLTRIGGAPTAILGERIEPASPGETPEGKMG